MFTERFAAALLACCLLTQDSPKAKAQPAVPTKIAAPADPAPVPQPATPKPLQILHLIDTSGRHFYVKATDIIRVESATFPANSTWVVLGGASWAPTITIEANATAVAQTWAATAGLQFHPITLGIPPTPNTGGASGVRP